MSAPLKLQNPKDRRAPSARDQDIYYLCKAQRVPQKDVAPRFDMKPPRVSQIVKEVGAWLANASAKDGELDHNQERRLERRIERERLEHLYGKSLRMLEDFEKPATASREGAKGIEKTTREERNARVQALKSCTRIAESLGKIAEREPLPEPAIKGTSGFIRFDHLQQELIRRRIEAEEHGKAPVSGDPYLVMWFLLRMMFGDPVKPLVPGSPLQGAMRKIVETLVEAGAVAGQESGVGGQESVSSFGAGLPTPPDAATAGLTAPRGAGDLRSGKVRGQETRAQQAATAPADGQRLSQLTPDPLEAAETLTDAGAKETKLAGYSLLDGCEPETLQDIIANGWLERFKDGGEMHQESLVAASLARENSGEFRASGQEPSFGAGLPTPPDAATAGLTEARGAGDLRSGKVRGQETRAQQASGPLCYAAAAKHRHPPEVGSPEWQVARAQWLQERDERVARERMQKIQERLERDEDVRQRRAAAAAKRRWLEAGQCQY